MLIDLLDARSYRELVNVTPVGDVYEASNGDPQIIIKPETELAAGWYRLELAIDPAGRVTPQVFFDAGEGFSEELSIRPEHVDGNIFACEFRLPYPVLLLRLDPTDEDGRFVLHSLQLRRLTGANLVNTLSARAWKSLQRDPGVFAKRLPLYFKSLRQPNLIKLRLSDPIDPVGDYRQWRERYEFDNGRDGAALRAKIEQLAEKPLISIVMPVYNTPAKLLNEAIASVADQIYSGWELCIADDCSTERHVRQILEEWQRRDNRIKIVFRRENGHISASSNSAAELATGEWIGLMDHDDVIPKNALAEVAFAINDRPGVDFIYTDEDKLGPDGQRVGHHFKPDWNEAMFLSHNYINHFAIYRASLFREVGGLRIGFEGSQDHDLGLRIACKTSPDRIVHIPKILYHWRAFEGSGTFSDKAIRRAIEARQQAAREYLVSRGARAEVVEGYFGRNRILYDLPDPAPKVSVIIPTRDGIDFLKNCLVGVLEGTDYPNLEVLIMDNESALDETKAYFDSIGMDPRVRVIHFAGAFNFSAINNAAVEASTGEVLCFLNNDIEIMRGDWLREMVSQAVQTATGAVGAKLLYRDGLIQHAGVVCGITGVAGHVFRFFRPNTEGYHARLNVVHQVSAVTGACMVVEKKKFLLAGGFDEINLKIAFNDIDLCLKLDALGYINIYTPYAELYHLESASRGSDHTAANINRFQSEIAYMYRVWPERLKRDPFYNENLTRKREDFSIMS